MSHTGPAEGLRTSGQDGLRQQRLPGHQRRGDERVVARVGPGGGHGAFQVVAVDVERVGLGERRAQRLGARLRLGWAGQKRLTAAAPARIRMIPP